MLWPDQKSTGNCSLICTPTNGIRTSFATQKKTKCFNENRFSGASFTGDDVKASREIYSETFDDGETLDRKMCEHMIIPPKAISTETISNIGGNLSGNFSSAGIKSSIRSL
jgi:hypothetical protein